MEKPSRVVCFWKTVHTNSQVPKLDFDQSIQTYTLGQNSDLVLWNLSERFSKHTLKIIIRKDLFMHQLIIHPSSENKYQLQKLLLH